MIAIQFVISSRLRVHLHNLIRSAGIGICLLFGFLANASVSQPPPSNPSLLQGTEDTTGIHQTIFLAEVYLNSNIDSAAQLLEGAWPTVERSTDKKLFFNALFIQGRIFEIRQQLDSALTTYSAARAIAESTKDKAGVASCLIQMGYVLHERNESQKGLQLLKEALRWSKESGDQNLEARAANGIGRVYSFLSEFDSSNIFLVQAMEIKKSLGDTRGLAEIYTNIANNYGMASKMDDAIEYFLRSQDLMRELNDIPGISHTYRNIGVTYFFNGKYPEALLSLHKALEVVEGTDHHADIIQNLDFLGEVYMTIKDFENAQLYWEKASKAFQIAYDNAINPDFLFKEGKALLARKEYALALRFFLNTEKLMQETGQFIGGDFFWNIGQSYEMLSELGKAEKSYLKAVERSQGMNTIFTRVKSLYGLGKIAEEKGQADQALGYYLESFDLAGTAGLMENEMAAAEGLYRIYKGKNDAGRALRFIEIANSIQDSLFNAENTRKIAKLEAAFQFEKEKQELEFAQRSKLAQEANFRRILWIALAVAVMILAVGVFYYRSKQKANAELSRLNKELSAKKAIVEDQKGKLEELDVAKSRFFTNISHEFRTPLTIISGMANQIKENPKAWAAKGSQMIKENSANLLNLVNQILDLRKLEAKELQLNMFQGDMIGYLRHLTHSYGPFAQSQGLLLHFLPAVDKLVMDFDPEKILRIISNLLSNAVKFTPDTGNVYLRVHPTRENRQNFLIIKVEDTGRGIDPDQLPHIFDRFYQVDDSATRKGEGTGIGLALTRELVHLMNGTIEVKSNPGQGTTFTISLPITNDAPLSEILTQEYSGSETQPDPGLVNPASPIVIKETDNKPDAELPTLLIVEDNSDIREFLVATLEKDYVLETATNGKEGIDLALEIVPDLIISDVMMPEKDGFELCETLKNDERTSHIPIILLTAKADIESRISGLKTGADAYMAKPFEQEELMVRLEKLFELRKKLQDRYRSLESKALPEDKEDQFVRKVRQVVLENISDETFGIAQLCRAITLSRAQLHNKLKALTGRSTSHFVRSIRLHKAKELLTSTEMNVSEIGYEVGFKNPSHFSSAFQEEFGNPPSHARK